MARTILAALLPAIGIAAAWLSLERTPQALDGLVVAALALVPAVVPLGARRICACVAAAFGAAWIAFGTQPWELLPFRDERVLGPVLRDAANGIVDFYAVFLPFEAAPNPEMHSLVLCAVFGFVLATGLMVSARRPLAAAGVTVAGIGWPATLLGGQAVVVGALALAAALAIPLVLRATSTRTVLAGVVIATLVVAGAAGTSSATTLGADAALDWETWDIRGEQREASDVRVIWDSNYEGISFPNEKTVVLRVAGPATSNYWRTTTLDQFADDRWRQNLYWLEQVDHDARELQRPQLLPTRAERPELWLEQRVEVEALVDDHLAAAGTPVALDARRLGTVFVLSGGVLRAEKPIGQGESYRIWSYAPDPAPRTLARTPVRYPPAAARFLDVDGRIFPEFGSEGRERAVARLFADPSYAAFRRHRAMYDVARRVAGDASSPYAAVLALESWFRQTGGFRYDESPPRTQGLPPLVAFVTRAKAGYCQHFAGAMAAMLRMLGVPARVAVGFTSGVRDDGEWVVTDHDAHAWVEVWFAGIGWVPFDPTPGRGTLGGEYTFASGSEAAVAALRRGELRRTAPDDPTRVPDAGDLAGDASSAAADRTPSLVGIALVLAAAWVVLLGLGKVVLRRARYLSRDPRRLATASRRELEDFLRDQGAEVPANATLATLQRAVQRELGLDARPFAVAAAQARFGPPGSVEAGASRARQEARGLLRAARRDLSVWARFRGLVSLRSLRTAQSS
ncbi:MAG TPA: transglutaminaseTgpA domain-containing protein [Gaiellaceae bacterium]|nr:transglutaminaseTgpA domain-containing protein [Gaiellaceae bacterium]